MNNQQWMTRDDRSDRIDRLRTAHLEIRTAFNAFKQTSNSIADFHNRFTRLSQAMFNLFSCLTTASTGAAAKYTTTNDEIEFVRSVNDVRFSFLFKKKNFFVVKSNISLFRKFLASF